MTKRDPQRHGRTPLCRLWASEKEWVWGGDSCLVAVPLHKPRWHLEELAAVNDAAPPARDLGDLPALAGSMASGPCGSFTTYRRKDSGTAASRSDLPRVGLNPFSATVMALDPDGSHPRPKKQTGEPRHTLRSPGHWRRRDEGRLPLHQHLGP